MKNILLTGSEGYIGLNFKALYGDQFNIIGIDKKLGQRAEKYFRFEEDKIDCVVHLAAISGIEKCENNIDDAIIDNIHTTSYLMMASWSFNIPLIFLSSQSAKNPQSSTYGMTKRSGEVIGERYNHNHGDMRMLRLTNVYGGKMYRQLKNSVISKFLTAIINKEKLKIDGDGSQTRDFIHVHEVCRCIKELINNNYKIKYPVDLGTGMERSIKEIALMLTEENNLEYRNERDTGSSSSIADLSSLYNLTKFKVQDFLEDYLRSESGWYWR